MIVADHIFIQLVNGYELEYSNTDLLAAGY